MRTLSIVVVFELGLADGLRVELDMDALGLRHPPTHIRYRSGRGTVLYRRVERRDGELLFRPRHVADRRVSPASAPTPAAGVVGHVDHERRPSVPVPQAVAYGAVGRTPV